MRQRASAIIIKDGKILLFHRFKNGHEYYASPGGAVEEGETPDEAVAREVNEELGLIIKIEKKLGELELDASTQLFYLVRSFSGEPILGGEEKERQSENNIYRIEWIDLAGLDKLDMRKEIKKIIKDAVASIT